MPWLSLWWRTRITRRTRVQKKPKWRNFLWHLQQATTRPTHHWMHLKWMNSLKKLKAWPMVIRTDLRAKKGGGAYEGYSTQETNQERSWRFIEPEEPGTSPQEEPSETESDSESETQIFDKGLPESCNEERPCSKTFLDCRHWLKDQGEGEEGGEWGWKPWSFEVCRHW